MAIKTSLPISFDIKLYVLSQLSVFKAGRRSGKKKEKQRHLSG